MQEAHEEVFNEVDCLKCANCCKTTGPLWTSKDIDRVSKSFRMKAVDFESRYLKMDEDGDMVLQKTPCAFLGSDNFCSIYDIRPKACREYPHTNRRKQIQILNLTHTNAGICPAVVRILDKVTGQLNA